VRDRLRTSLWVVPVGFSVAGAGLALTLLHIDEQLDPDTSAWFLYGGQAEGARALLSTIASSMLTIAGLVFSITILVLQLASSQFSPRILSTFLQDRVTQSSLGMFLGSFVYAMMLLPRVRSETSSSPAFVPGVSVYVAFVLVLISVGFFVRYIHHMAHSIRAVNIIVRVAHEAHASIQRLYPQDFLEEPSEPHTLPSTPADLVVKNSRDAGVVIHVDHEALLHIARSRDLLIELIPRVGDFVPRGAPLCRVWGVTDRGGLEANEWVVLATERTPRQDPMFGFRQLVDVAERALSPGVNDPSTAKQALDHLHDLLRALARRSIPAAARVDDQGVLRLWLPHPDWADYVQMTFREIRSYGSGSIQIVEGARAALADLLTIAPPARAAALHTELQRFELQAGSRPPPDAG
jgi:uncharacterized membrane protein